MQKICPVSQLCLVLSKLYTMICILNWHELSLTWIFYLTSQGLIMRFILIFNHIKIILLLYMRILMMMIIYDRQRYMEDFPRLPTTFGSNLISSQQQISCEWRWNLVSMFIFTYSIQLVNQTSRLRAQFTIQQFLHLPTKIRGCYHQIDPCLD